VCGFLSDRQLAAFAGEGQTGMSGCRRAKQLEQGDAVADAVETKGDVTIAFVHVNGEAALVEALDALGRSVELDLVAEDGEWRVDADPDEIAGAEEMVGQRLPPTEQALFEALLFGPADGDAPALAAATRLARRYVSMIEADDRFSVEARRRKLAAMPATATI